MLACGDVEVIRLVLMEHRPLYLHLFVGVALPAFRIMVAKNEANLQEQYHTS
jgi:hypothetical protein